MIYIWFRFEWQFGVGAMIVDLPRRHHDGRPVRAAAARIQPDDLAAILTIAGYSINDTVVVYDRMRESCAGTDDAVPRLINLAINETLSRTIVTVGDDDPGGAGAAASSAARCCAGSASR